jgi:hypothetical protein
MIDQEPGLEHPPLKLRRHRRVLFPDMVEIKLPRRQPKPPKPAKSGKPSRPAKPAKASKPPKPEPKPKLPPTAVVRKPAEEYRPLYWRMLGLRHVQPNGWLRALFVEGSVAIGVVLVLAEAASVWTILALPVIVAVLVKANDIIAGALKRDG